MVHVGRYQYYIPQLWTPCTHNPYNTTCKRKKHFGMDFRISTFFGNFHHQGCVRDHPWYESYGGPIKVLGPLRRILRIWGEMWPWGHIGCTEMNEKGALLIPLSLKCLICILQRKWSHYTTFDMQYENTSLKMKITKKYLNLKKIHHYFSFIFHSY